MLSYIKEFPMATEKNGWVTPSDCKLDWKNMGIFIHLLGVLRHTENYCWKVSRKLENLGVTIDTAAMNLLVADRKDMWVRRTENRIVFLAQRNKPLEFSTLLRLLFGIRVALVENSFGSLPHPVHLPLHFSGGATRRYNGSWGAPWEKLARPRHYHPDFYGALLRENPTLRESLGKKFPTCLTGVP